MYMVEISEDKIDNMMEHIGKSIKCLSKVAECLEDIKGGSDYDYDDDEERDEYAAGGRNMYRQGGRSRYARGGRYGRY